VHVGDRHRDTTVVRRADGVRLVDVDADDRADLAQSAQVEA